MKNGFTLIEMVVVLVVMALAAHLAVREFSRVNDRRMTETADRQLKELRDAVWSLDADGAPCGFLADMGRLPRSLDELWAKPDDARPFAVTNVASGVYVPTGWNGPYIRLPLGKRGLYDPWGNDFCVVTNSMGFVTNVFHTGSSGQARTRSYDVSLVPKGGENSSIVVALESSETGGVQVSWYGPDGFGGVTNAPAKIVTAATPARFDGLTPGMRVLSCGEIGIKIFSVKPGENNFIQLRAAN